ncbi:hypothetical protein Vretimale_4377 [Volvox reticuliferus]|uniref:Uncharacterized protein n=1 Tax=Volvox reticuliferus TaxID=1737510 RepID=A0A8J4C3R3_9CHLO|nr:hypothetical protein Vretifemale_2975 [Volvox reticuliferus]GIL99111.1 hypothetical protein Vretimale_4377 [Volvox reticuliferus]
MEDQSACQLEEQDFVLLQALLNGALSRTSTESVHVQRAVEAVIAMLSGGTQIDFQLKAPRQAQQIDDLMLRRPIVGEPSSLMDLGAQVSEATERVSTLRRRAAQIIMPALSAQLEALRPVQLSGEVTLLTPGRSGRSPNIEADVLRGTSNDKLLKAVDKLPALRARLDEVTKRMVNVIRAIEVQTMLAKTESTPIRALTPSNCDADRLISVIARVSRQ